MELEPNVRFLRTLWKISYKRVPGIEHRKYSFRKSNGGSPSLQFLSHRNYSNLSCLFTIQHLICNNLVLSIHFHACPNYFRFLSRHAVNTTAIKSVKIANIIYHETMRCGFWQTFRYIDVQSVVSCLHC